MAPRSNTEVLESLARLETKLGEMGGVLSEMREDLRGLAHADSKHDAALAVLDTKVRSLESSAKSTRAWLGGLALTVIGVLVRLVFGAVQGGQ